MNKTYDLIIVGGGLSALLLAYFLEKSAANLNFKILEQKEKYIHDRHWGTWLNADQQRTLKDIISTSYASWSVIDPNMNSCTKHSDHYKYCVIRSGDFYNFMQAHLSGKINLDEDCTHVNQNEVITNKSTYNARMIIDARPTKIPNCKIFQQFAGWVIETTEPVFSQDTMTLMDFSMPQNQDSCGFMYVLPFSSHKALIEPTLFTSTLYTSDYFKQQKTHYLQQLGASSWSVIDQEQAVLPMAVYNIPQIENQAFPIGRRAGWMRASSGYAFYTSLILSQKLANHIVTHRSLPKRPLKTFSHISKTLDSLYLQVIEDTPEIMPDVFKSWFDKMPSEDIISFLNNEAGPMTYLKLLLHTAHKKHFIRALWRN